MNYLEMCAAVEDAEKTLGFADMAADKVASQLVGRLRHVDNETLRALKRELRLFNMNTGEWKE